MLSLQYAYLLSTLGLVPVYAAIYFLRPDVRHKMLRLSMWGIVLGPISQLWYVSDYWHPLYALPNIGIIEDALFSSLVFGVSAGIVNILLSLRTVPASFGNKKIRYAIAAGVVLGALLLFTNLFGINSIYASVLGFVLLWLYIMYERRDLLVPSLVGGLFWVVAIAIMYNLILLIWPTFISSFWLFDNISGKLFLNIPLEEFLWFFTFGIVGTVLFEWKRGLRFEKIVSL